MKVVWLPAALLSVLAAGCAGTEIQAPESIEDRFTKLEVQVTQKMDKAHNVYTELIDKTLDLNRRMAKLENDLDLLKIDLKRLTERFDQSGTAPRSGPPLPAGEGAEITMKIDQAL